MGQRRGGENDKLATRCITLLLQLRNWSAYLVEKLICYFSNSEMILRGRAIGWIDFLLHYVMGWSMQILQSEDAVKHSLVPFKYPEIRMQSFMVHSLLSWCAVKHQSVSLYYYIPWPVALMICSRTAIRSEKGLQLLPQLHIRGCPNQEVIIVNVADVRISLASSPSACSLSILHLLKAWQSRLNNRRHSAWCSAEQRSN